MLSIRSNETVPATKKSPLSAGFRHSEVHAKPLPPTPTFRVASSVYSVYVEGAPRTPKFAKSGNALPSKVHLNPRQSLKQRASTSNLPDNSSPPLRPRLTQSKTHPAVGRLAERKKIRSSFYREWKAPKWEENSDIEEVSDEGKTLGQDDLQPSTGEGHGHVEDNLSILAAKKAMMPSSLIPGITIEPSHHENDDCQDPLTPGPLKIETNGSAAGDGTVTPSERFSSDFDEDCMPTSRWSSTSSSPTSPIKVSKMTFRSRAQKAFLAQTPFHARKNTPEKREKKTHKREVSRSSWTSHSTGDSNGSPMNPCEADIQKGILNIFDTLDSPCDLSSPNARASTDITRPKNVLRKRRSILGSSEVMKTSSPHSRSDRKSWSTQGSVDSRASISSEYRDMIMKYSFARRQSVKERSVGKKLVSAVGLSKGKNAKKASEKKRQEMKKKIVVVGGRVGSL